MEGLSLGSSVVVVKLVDVGSVINGATPSSFRISGRIINKDLLYKYL